MLKSQTMVVLLVLTVACGSEPVNLAPSPAPPTTVERPCINTRPLVLMDGVAVDFEMLNTLDQSQVETINIFQNPSTDRFGPGAECGAIVVTTK